MCRVVRMRLHVIYKCMSAFTQNLHCLFFLPLFLLSGYFGLRYSYSVETESLCCLVNTEQQLTHY